MPKQVAVHALAPVPAMKALASGLGNGRELSSLHLAGQLHFLKEIYHGRQHF